ncbi:hypothetical protein EXIGLDRAFT_782627 [Exidia glandulosa HHB12029]|uniref:Uncharacterized protein n=1 Tax=Exidia glandulosa HHB12029 TaxID=1314781 RepID=A0A166NJP5_EXIGL|nr:hypothetical protein EXIGLDRAFT_782627 [Exidia glandulosa HHB12029]
MSETVPKYLQYQERFVRGDWHFGDKVTTQVLACLNTAGGVLHKMNVADLKVYTLCLFIDDMLGNKNPILVLAAEFPKLNKIIKTLEAGKAGEYAKARRNFGKFGSFADECKWGPKA